MKRFLLVLLFTIPLFSQSKQSAPASNQRYTIYDLGDVGGFKTVFLLDTQTGRTWEMVKDTSAQYFDKNEQGEDSSAFIYIGSVRLWKEVVFSSGNKTFFQYDRLPPPIIPQKK